MLFSCATNSVDDESMLLRKLGCLANGRYNKKGKGTMKMERDCDFPDTPPPTAPQVKITRKASVRSNQSSAAKCGELVVVKQNFTASVVDEISVSQGEIVSLLYIDGEWAYVTTSSSKHQQGGFVPTAYCQYMTDEEVERTRKRVVKFEDKGSPSSRPQPTPRSGAQKAPPVEPRPTVPTASNHPYHTLEGVAIPRSRLSNGVNFSQSMIVIPQKFHQISPQESVDLSRGAYASATMKQDFHTMKGHKYENHEANASMPNLAHISNGTLPRKMARPKGATEFSVYDGDNYIIPNPPQAKIQSSNVKPQEFGKPPVVRCDDLMSIDSQSMVSLTGSTHSDGGTSLAVNLPGTYPSSTVVPAFKAKVLFNFNSDGHASGEHICAMAGDVVDVIGQDGEDWHWVQTKDKRIGLIPACFLQPVHPEALLHCNVAPSHSAPTQKDSPRSRSPRRSVATSAPATYEPKNPGPAGSRNAPQAGGSPAGKAQRGRKPSGNETRPGGQRTAASGIIYSTTTPPRQQPADSDLSRWLEKHSPSGAQAPNHRDLQPQESVTYSIVTSYSNDSRDYDNVSNVRSNETIPSSLPLSEARAVASGGSGHHDEQTNPQGVAQLAAKLGNLVVVTPQPQKQQAQFNVPQKGPQISPKPDINASTRPPVAPKPRAGSGMPAVSEKTQLYATSSYSSLPETFRCSSTSPDYGEDSIYSSAEDIAIQGEEGLEDEESVSRLEMISDFVANGNSQVSVIEGDIVLANTEKSTRGWLWVCVERTGMQGFVPLSYTQIYETWAD